MNLARTRTTVPGLGLALLLANPAASAAEPAEVTLCAAGETVVFSCHQGRKIVSLCHPANAAHALSYRFGTPGRVELAYPDPGRQESARFTRVELPEYGGASQTVGFRRGDYEYAVYSAVARGEDGNGAAGAPGFEDGLLVSRAGKPLKKTACDDGGAGFRDDIAWIEAP